MFLRPERLPAAAFSADVEEFGACLESLEQDYLLVEQTSERRARLRFCGGLLGRTVVWDCDFLALDATRAACNFIDVDEPGLQGVPVQVGLAVSCIDRPAIEKMILMIRNYKRLRPGRHEFGGSRQMLSPEA